MQNTSRYIDIEFTLALNNRTGKYFFCRDLIECDPDNIVSILYWRLSLKTLPTGLRSRILGRLARDEIRLRRAFPALHRLLPLVRRARPVVFMDPREVVMHALKAADCVICHDVGPITHPALYHHTVKPTYEMAFAKICAAKPSLIFVSEAGMQEFVSLYGSDFRSMTVISPPLRAGLIDGPEEAVPGVTRPYLLTVGSIGARKNQVRSIEAFHRANVAADGCRYVLCGGPEPGFEAVALRADETPGVTRLGYVSDGQLRWLYRNAIGFVLPSLLEGFGLPAAEAIAHGLVPLVSQDSALAEVTGSSAILVDPYDVEDIAAGITRLCTMTPAERNDRLRELKASIEKYSPEAMKKRWRDAIAV